MASACPIIGRDKRAQFCRDSKTKNGIQAFFFLFSFFLKERETGNRKEKPTFAEQR